MSIGMQGKIALRSAGNPHRVIVPPRMRLACDEGSLRCMTTRSVNAFSKVLSRYFAARAAS